MSDTGCSRLQEIISVPIYSLGMTVDLGLTNCSYHRLGHLLGFDTQLNLLLDDLAGPSLEAKPSFVGIYPYAFLYVAGHIRLQEIISLLHFVGIYSCVRNQIGLQ